MKFLHHFFCQPLLTTADAVFFIGLIAFLRFVSLPALLSLVVTLAATLVWFSVSSIIYAWFEDHYE